MNNTLMSPVHLEAVGLRWFERDRQREAWRLGAK